MKKYVVLGVILIAIIGIFVTFIFNGDVNLDDGNIIMERENEFNFSVVNLDISKGKYSTQDSVYIYMQLNENNYFYSKYVFSKDDVNSLKMGNLKLKVRLQSKIGNEYELKYIIVDKRSVKSFERKHLLESEKLMSEPKVAKVLYSGSLEDQIVDSSEFDNNDEKIDIVFYPSQLYTLDNTIKIIDSSGNHIKDIELTDEHLKVLQNSFLHLEVDFSDEVNKKQSKLATYHYFVKIYDSEHNEINNTYFNFKVDK